MDSNHDQALNIINCKTALVETASTIIIYHQLFLQTMTSPRETLIRDYLISIALRIITKYMAQPS